jgi:Flp pilus assembly protein TadD
MFKILIPLKWILILFIVFLISGCGIFGNNSRLSPENDFDLQKIIEGQRQKMNVEIEEEAEPELTAAEYEKIGDQFLQNNDRGSAFINYSKALESDPDNIKILYAQAILLLDKNLYYAASLKFKKISEIDPQNAIALEGLGKSYFGLDKIVQAENAFSQAIKFDPKLWQSYNFLGLISSQRKDFDSAITNYIKAMDINPNNTELLNNLAVSYYLTGNNEGAIELLTKASKKRGADKRIFNNLALSYCRIGKYDDALQAFLVANDEAAAYNNIGYEYLMNEEYEEAIKAFNKAISINPQFYEKAFNNMKTAKKAMRGLH